MTQACRLDRTASGQGEGKCAGERYRLLTICIARVSGLREILP